MLSRKQSRLRNDPTTRFAARLVAAAALALAAGTASAERAKSIFGWVEQVRLEPSGLTLRAKLDTGATTSSINAQDIEHFKRDGEEWVRFDIVDPENDNKQIEFERKIERGVRIKRHGGEFQPRDVVRMGVCLGHVYREVEVSLANRKGFNYQMLIGRNFMEGYVVVDPGSTFTADPACKDK